MTTYDRDFTTFSSDSASGTVAWSNPSNAASSDNSRASLELYDPGQTTHYLKALDLSSNIPGDGATEIDQIIVYVEGYDAAAADVEDKRVSLVVGGTVQSVNKSSNTDWMTSESERSYTFSGADLPAGLDIDDVNGATFGVVVQLWVPGEGLPGLPEEVHNVFIDKIRVQIGVPDPPTSGSFAGTSTTSGILVADGKLVGTFDGSASFSGTLSTTVPISGSFAGTSFFEARIPKQVGSWESSSIFSGSLRGIGPLLGTFAGTSTLSGTLNITSDISGTFSGTASVSGTGRMARYGAGIWFGTSSFGGIARMRGYLEGSVSGTASFSGSFNEQVSGFFAGLASLSGVLEAKGKLAGVFTGTCVRTGNLRGRVSISGSFAGTSQWMIYLERPRYYTGEFQLATSPQWTNPTYALVDDTDSAEIADPAHQSANKLILKKWTTKVPMFASVKGFLVMLKAEIPTEASPPDPPQNDWNFDVYLTKDGVNSYGAEPLQYVGDMLGIGGEWKGSASWLFMSSALTPEEINSENFGLYIQANGPNEWARTHTGLEPDYDPLTPVNVGPWDFLNPLKVQYAKLYVFVEFDQDLEGEGHCDGTVELSWRVD